MLLELILSHENFLLVLNLLYVLLYFKGLLFCKLSLYLRFLLVVRLGLASALLFERFLEKLKET